MIPEEPIPDIPEKICNLDSRRRVLEKIKGRIDAGSRVINFYGPTLTGKSAIARQLEVRYSTSLFVCRIDLAAKARTGQQLWSGIIRNLHHQFTPTAVGPEEVSKVIESVFVAQDGKARRNVLIVDQTEHLQRLVRVGAIQSETVENFLYNLIDTDKWASTVFCGCMDFVQMAQECGWGKLIQLVNRDDTIKLPGPIRLQEVTAFVTALSCQISNPRVRGEVHALLNGHPRLLVVLCTYARKHQGGEITSEGLKTLFGSIQKGEETSFWEALFQILQHMYTELWLDRLLVIYAIMDLLGASAARSVLAADIEAHLKHVQSERDGLATSPVNTRAALDHLEHECIVTCESDTVEFRIDIPRLVRKEDIEGVLNLQKRRKG